MELDAHAVNWRWSLSDGWQSSESYLRRDASSGGAYREDTLQGLDEVMALDIQTYSPL